MKTFLTLFLSALGIIIFIAVAAAICGAVSDKKPYSEVINGMQSDFEVLSVEYSDDQGHLPASLRSCKFILYKENCEQLGKNELTRLINKFRLAYADSRFGLILIEVYNDQDTYHVKNKYDGLMSGRWTNTEGKHYLAEDEKLSAEEVRRLKEHYIAFQQTGDATGPAKDYTFERWEDTGLPVVRYPLRGSKTLESKNIVANL